MERLKQASTQWKSTPEELREIELHAGLCKFNLGQKKQAAEHFRTALRIDEGAELPPYTSPKAVDLFLEVKKALPPRAGTGGKTFEIGQGACGRAAKTLATVYIPDLETDTATYLSRPGSLRGRGSLLAIPIVHQKVLMGVFNKSMDEATRIMWQAHRNGTGLCGVYPLEVAETKVQVVTEAARENGFPLKLSLEEE